MNHNIYCCIASKINHHDVMFGMMPCMTNRCCPSCISTMLTYKSMMSGRLHRSICLEIDCLPFPKQRVCGVRCWLPSGIARDPEALDLIASCHVKGILIQDKNISRLEQGCPPVYTAPIGISRSENIGQLGTIICQPAARSPI